MGLSFQTSVQQKHVLPAGQTGEWSGRSIVRTSMEKGGSQHPRNKCDPSARRRSQQAQGGKEVKESKKIPYEKPAVVFEKELEAVAADCGSGLNSPYLGGNNCKSFGQCTVPYS